MTEHLTECGLYLFRYLRQLQVEACQEGSFPLQVRPDAGHASGEFCVWEGIPPSYSGRMHMSVLAHTAHARGSVHGGAPAPALSKACRPARGGRWPPVSRRALDPAPSAPPLRP